MKTAIEIIDEVMEQAILMAREDDEMWAVLASETILKRIENECGWISVEERLPKEFWEYMVFWWREEDVTTREFDTDQNIWIHWDRNSMYAFREITHWMPLPLAPKK